MLGKRICRVCGKEYTACASISSGLTDGFRWQEVACSPECGSIYLKRIMDSRSQNNTSNTESETSDNVLSTSNPTEDVVCEDSDSETIEEVE